ncbi:MAG: Double-GTPase 1 [Acidobacteriota bacterium]|jgi:GTPase SAR1 family protein|nr:Double-GTPase 1 [Acidobacteriota bacterium]
MEEHIIEALFKVIGELLLVHALQSTMNSRRRSSSLAKLIVAHPGFEKIDKEALLTDETSFRKMLGSVREIYRDSLPNIDGILDSPDSVRRIQAELTNHPFLTQPIKLTTSSERHNFLVLGHPQAGKTSLIQRMLYGLSQNSDIGVFASDSETLSLPNRIERFAKYQEHRIELARNNEKLDRGELFPSTGSKNDIYVNIEYRSTGYMVRLKFFDYSGIKMQSIRDLAQLTDDKRVDGIIVLMDSYRIIAEDLLDSASKNGLLDRKAHEIKYGQVLQSNLSQFTDLTNGLLDRIEFLKHHQIPIIIAFTKFDGFRHFGQSEEGARQAIYSKIHPMLHSLIKMKRHAIALCLTSSFGGSELAKDEVTGELIVEDQYTALPVLRPTGRFTLNQYLKAQSPLLFLVRSIMQDKIEDMHSFFEQQRQELGFLDRFIYRGKLDQVGKILHEENNRWKNVSPEREDLLIIPPDSDTHLAIRRLREFFKADIETL